MSGIAISAESAYNVHITTKGNDMQFNRSEWEILLHRLEASNAIAEVLSDEYGLDYDLVDDRARDMAVAGPSSVKDSELDMMILRDCCDGCTFFCDIDDAISNGETTTGHKLAWLKAAKSLEQKLGVPVTTA